MKRLQFLKKITKSEFLAGSLIMIVGTNFYNFGQFIYHAITGRALGTALYGDFATLISVVGFIGILQLTMGIAIVKFIAQSKADDEIENFAKWINRWSNMAAIAITLILLIASPFIISFLKISDPVSFLLLLPIIYLFTVTNALRAILQGLLKFDKFIIVLLSESVIKIVLTTLLIYVGLGLAGATFGWVVGMLASFLAARIFLRKLLKGKRRKRPNIKPLLKFSAPVLVSGVALTSMYTMDLFLVKHFFDTQTTSLYASLSVLGRVVFFGTSPITQVMFPIITKKHAHGAKYHSILVLSIILVIGFSTSITLLYLFFPSIPIKILFGSSFLAGSKYLWWFAIFMGILAINNMLTQFYLSINKTKVVILFLLASILQGLLIWYSHATILVVIQMSIIAASLLTVSLLAYYPFHDK